MGLTSLPCFIGDTAPGLVRIPGCEPEDLVQATFLGVLETHKGWDGRRPVGPWLAGILG